MLLDSGEWGKDWFGDSTSTNERRPLLTSSGQHVRRHFDPDGPEFRYCGFHVRRVAAAICFWEFVALVITLIVACVWYSDPSTIVISTSTVQASANVTTVGATTAGPLVIDRMSHAARMFAITLTAIVIGVPCLVAAVWGIKTERVNFLLPHMIFELSTVIVAFGFLCLTIYEASRFTNAAHEWAGRGNRDRRDENFRLMTLHIELAIFLGLVIASECAFFLVSRRCLVHLRAVGLHREGRLAPEEVAELKTAYKDVLYVY